MAQGTIDGTATNQCAGYIVAGAGDVNGDGQLDLVFGARHADGEAGEDVGAIYLVYGPPGGGNRPVDPRELRLEGETANGRAGRIVDGGADLTGDGIPDLLTGAPLARRTGAAYVIPGPIQASGTLASAHRLLGEAAGDRLGDLNGARPAGDLNGDGYQDIVVASKYHDQAGEDAGAVYLLDGPLSGDLSAAAAAGKWVGEQAGDLAGYHATTAGDVNGDGLADVVIGAAEADLLAVDSGAVYVLFGPATGQGSLADAPVRLSGEDADDRAGQSVASAGDIDGDGLDDIYVGANGRNDKTGRIYFLAGSQL